MILDVIEAEGITATARTPEKGPQIGGPGFHLAMYIVGGGLSAFIAGVAGAAGTDAWKKSKALVKRLHDAYVSRYPTPPEVLAELELELVDEEGTRLFLRSSYPDEAFERVEDREFEPNTWYVWDEERGEWSARVPGTLGFDPHPRRSLWQRFRRLFGR